MELTAKISIPYKEWIRLKNCEKELNEKNQVSPVENKEEAGEKMSGEGCGEIGSSLPLPLQTETPELKFASRAEVIVKDSPQSVLGEVSKEQTINPVTSVENVSDLPLNMPGKKSEWFFLGYP